MRKHHLTRLGASLIFGAAACVTSIAPTIAATATPIANFHAKVHPAALSNISAFTPEQIRGAYGLSAGDTGKGITIAIVDAYDNPNALADFDAFSKRFNLPTSAACGCFVKVDQSGGTHYPQPNTGWGQEIALDIEWAHAIAPLAKIVLVEANSAGFTDLLTAEDYATKNAQVVSNSWGSNEFNGETTFDSHFNKPVAITFSSGDSGSPAAYPSSSPYVLSVGGTNLTVAATAVCPAPAPTPPPTTKPPTTPPSGTPIPPTTTGTPTPPTGTGTTPPPTGTKHTVINVTTPAPCTTTYSYGSEHTWLGGGGGASRYEAMPGYQQGFCGTTLNINNCAGKRGTPDLAWVADPNSGVAMVDGTTWYIAGGTSLSAPSVAGAIADADAARKLTLTTNNLTTRNFFQSAAKTANYAKDYHDVTTGTNGSPCCTASKGYDLATGLGSPNVDSWIANL